jgi:outer membrane protein TolC
MNVVVTSIALAVALAQAPAGEPSAQQAPAPQEQPQSQQRQPPQPETPARSPERAAGPAEAAAVDAPGSGDVLTLEGALDLAARRSLDLKVLAAQLEQADEISWKAWASQLPQVTAVGSFAHQPEITFPVSEAPGGEAVVQNQNQFQSQIELTIPVFAPSLWAGIRGASRSERAAKLGIENGRRSLFFGVASAFYGVASLKQVVGVSERLLEIAQRQEKDARVRYQAGTIAKVGLLRAEIDRARAEQDLRRARNGFASAKVGLATLLDRDTSFDVAAPPEPALPDDASADALVEIAIRSRPDVQAARVQVDAARANRTGAYARYLPNVGAFGRYQYSDPGGLFGAGENWALGLQAQWQLLDGGRRESDIREQGAKVAEAEASAARAEASARRDVLQAVLDLESARANALKAKEQRDLAAENLRLVDVSYRAGAATAVELADATAQSRNAEIGFTTETLGAQLAALRVLNVAGEFDPVPRKRR